MEFPTHGQYPPVQTLDVHLKDKQCVYFNRNLSASQLEEKAENTRSTLMGFF
ncbi:hypothetical protein E4U10_000290, partial [Claviceps purpurea]